MQYYEIELKLVSEIRTKLNKPGKNNNLTLCWIPRHTRKNVEADTLGTAGTKCTIRIWSLLILGTVPTISRDQNTHIRLETKFLVG